MFTLYYYIIIRDLRKKGLRICASPAFECIDFLAHRTGRKDTAASNRDDICLSRMPRRPQLWHAWVELPQSKTSGDVERRLEYLRIFVYFYTNLYQSILIYIYLGMDKICIYILPLNIFYFLYIYKKKNFKLILIYINFIHTYIYIFRYGFIYFILLYIIKMRLFMKILTLLIAVSLFYICYKDRTLTPRQQTQLLFVGLFF